MSRAKLRITWNEDMKSIGIFVDVSNLYYCVGKKFDGKKLDYGKYTSAVTGPDDIVYRTIAYGMQIDTEATKFIACLKHLGFETKYKKPRVHQTTEGKAEVRRVPWNVGIAMDIVRIVSNNKLDEVIIGSADPELASLVEWIKERGIRCKILACGISKELKEVADEWKEITEELIENRDEITSTT